MTKRKHPLAYDDEPAGRSPWKSLYKTLISSVLLILSIFAVQFRWNY